MFLCIVVSKLKRQAEDQVVETIRAQLPIVGEMGTVLDYEKTLKMPSRDVKIYSDLKNAERAGLNEAFFSADLDPVELY